jgi:hypothetical protein
MFATPDLSEAVAVGESPTAGGRLWTIADCFINPQHETNLICGWAWFVVEAKHFCKEQLV